jgi:hypothetical protein
MSARDISDNIMGYVGLDVSGGTVSNIMDL